MDYKSLLRIATLAEASAVAADGFKLAKKKKRKVGDFLGYGTEAIVGTELIKAQADLI